MTISGCCGSWVSCSTTMAMGRRCRTCTSTRRCCSGVLNPMPTRSLSSTPTTPSRPCATATSETWPTPGRSSRSSSTDSHAVVLLPAEPWARRVSGVYANELAQAAPHRAHAMLTSLPEGGYVVSVRAPIATGDGADVLCRQFATGGGRKAAAGINHLPESELSSFLDAMAKSFST
jgi:hypothetical protein